MTSALNAALATIASEWESIIPSERPTSRYHQIVDLPDGDDAAAFSAVADRGFIFGDPERSSPISESAEGEITRVEWVVNVTLLLGSIGMRRDELREGIVNETNLLARALESRADSWPLGVLEVQTAEASVSYDSGSGLAIGNLTLFVLCEEVAQVLTTSFVNRRSLRFDGVNDYIYIADHADLQLTSALTLSCWMRLDAALPNRTLASKWAFATDGGWALQTGVNNAQARRLVLYLATASSSNLAACNIQTGNVWTPGQWHHVAWTFDAGTVAIYVDGVSVAWTLIQGSIPSALLASQAELRFGAWSGSLNRFFGAGNIDEIALYARALSGAEVQALASGGRPVDISSIGTWDDAVLWLRCGDGDAWPVINDRRAGGGAATLIGGHPATMVNMAAGSIVTEVP